MSDGLVKKRSSCRLCDSKAITLVLPMKPSPIADAFIQREQKNVIQPLIPLDLYQCQSCGHVQNLDIVDPSVLFRDYIFQTGNSAGLVNHFKEYAKNIVEQFQLEKDSLVVEIGSNDGTLLKFFKDYGLRVIGVDPAVDIAKSASENGIATIPDFFSTVLAQKILKENGKAKLIVANNVYAHSDQLADITDGIELLLDNNGVFVFEVSYLLDIVDKFLFDTVYHEHLSYHSISPLVNFFKLHQLELFAIERIQTKGGSIRCFAQKIGGQRNIKPIVRTMIEAEALRKLHEPAIFYEYNKQIQLRKKAVDDFFSEAAAKNWIVAGYGASTTVITLMYQFELENKLAYLIDDNTKKQGMLSPGAHLEVEPSSILYTDKPDAVIILAWQYADPIIQKNLKYLENDGVFIIPLPELTIMNTAHCDSEI